jgi:hypothetical protein
LKIRLRVVGHPLRHVGLKGGKKGEIDPDFLVVVYAHRLLVAGLHKLDELAEFKHALPLLVAKRRRVAAAHIVVIPLHDNLPGERGAAGERKAEVPGLGGRAKVAFWDAAASLAVVAAVFQRLRIVGRRIVTERGAEGHPHIASAGRRPEVQCAGVPALILGGLCDIVGRVCVRPEEVGDFLAHWKDAPRSNAPALATARSKENAMVSAMLAATRRSAPAPAAARSQQDPMISAMVRAAKKHPLNRAAILRAC